MRSLLLAVLATLLIGGCSEFNKALKSTDLQYKLEVAEKFYQDGDYEKALPLLEELVALTRGTSLSERVNYYHAKSFFGLKDYTLAAYYLGSFVRTFPTSVHAEECSFLSAYCHYKNSPTYELDQQDTKLAIDKMQLFLIRYPETELTDSCNTLIDQMRTKLELKQWEGAKQYYKTRYYRSASIAMRSFLAAWPTSQYREEALLYILRSQHQLAMNSIEAKKQERLEEAIGSYLNFVDSYGESKYMKEASQMYNDLLTESERVKTTDR